MTGVQTCALPIFDSAQHKSLSMRGGIKYTLIVRPVADLSLVKMHYGGDVEHIAKDKAGNIVIATEAGEIIDHAPESYFEGETGKVNLEFQLNNDRVMFALNSEPRVKTLVIDPWTTVPTSLTTSNGALDVDIDNFGNVFVSGGTSPYKLSKYSTTGTLLWTFTKPYGWGLDKFYSKFCVLPNSGTTFIGEGFSNTHPRIMKINSNGLLNYTSIPNGANNEIWSMFYNNCTKQLLAFGGGTNSNNNIKIIADTNLTNAISQNFNGSVGFANDVACSVMDNNGDFYALLTNGAINTIEGHLLKSLYSTNYNPPCAFDVQTNYQFHESHNLYGMSSSVSSVRANALSLNSSYIFSYDGRTLKAWNKGNGILLDSIIVDYSYLGGKYYTHDGIVADECNNVYVGGTNKVHVFSFNGTNFTQINPITTNINNEVYDIFLNPANGILYVSGLGFVTTIDNIVCSANNLSVSMSVLNEGNCHFGVNTTVGNGTAPYTYHWSNGASTNPLTGVTPGVYYVTITDNSCIPKYGFDSIVINPFNNFSVSNDTSICHGSSILLSAQGANSYSWSPASSLSSSTGSTVTATPTANTTYTVVGTFASGCTAMLTVTINLLTGPTINITNDTAICLGESIMLNASGGTGYLWSPSGSLSSATISNPIASPSITTIYSVIVYSPVCNLTGTVKVKVISIIPTVSSPTQICKGETVQLSASGGTSYFWSPAYGLSNPNISSPMAFPDSTTHYLVKISEEGCFKVDSVTITVIDCYLNIPNVFTPNDDGVNDLFDVVYKGNESFYLIICNRWGKKVFESDDRNNQWNGKIKNTDAADGVYYYVLVIGKKEYDGTVTLMR